MFFICKDGHKKFDLVALLITKSLFEPSITSTSVGLFIYLFIYLFIIYYLSICLLIYLFVCLFICLFYPISR